MQKKARKGYYSLASLGRDRVFSVAIELSGCVATWFFASRHGSQAASGHWVAIGVFLVATELFFFCFSVTKRAPTVSP